jgi:hypothetical protein
MLSGAALDTIVSSSGEPAAGACLRNTEPTINLSQRFACPIGIEIDESFEDRHASFAGGSSQPVQSNREVRQLRRGDCGGSSDIAQIIAPSVYQLQGSRRGGSISYD